MSRKDSENLARLESIRPRFERLRELKIRNAGDIERAQADVAAAEAEAVKIAGTSDLDEIRLEIQRRYDANTAAVDEFVSLIESVEAKLAAVDETAAEGSKAA